MVTAAWAAAAAILAQTAAPVAEPPPPPAAAAGVTVYPAAWFAPTQPETALDMVGRLPGFSFEAGDDEVRGYAAASGNVLIDGRRPASKYDPLEEVLRRIPASAVERIELIRGGAPGLDMQGQTLVANVVRAKAAAVEAQVSAGLRVHADGRVLPEARAEGSRRWGDRLLEGSAYAYRLTEDEAGEGSLRSVFADGTVDDRADELTEETRGLQLSAGYEQPLGGGRLRVNGALLAERLDGEELTGASTLSDAERLTAREDTLQGEVGLRYDRRLGPRTELEALAIQQLRRLREDELELEGGESEAARETSTSGETIARATLRFAADKRWAFEWSGEAAYNFLDGRTEAFEDDVPVELPFDEARVEELRAEATARATWRLSDNLTLEGAAALEVSRIVQSGDASLERSFLYPKPRLFLAWTPSAANQVRLRIGREVGQLDFGDFVASAELSTGTVSAGAVDLEPATAWVFEAAWEHRFAGDASLTLTLRHQEIADVVDRILVEADGELFDAPGNIGSGRMDELQLGLSLPLDGVGIPGGLLKGDLTWRRSAVVDPVTGEDRAIGGQEDFEGTLEFSQDLPRWRSKWGVDLELGEEEPEFRFDEVRREGTRTWVSVWAEHRPAPGWSVRVEAANLTARDSYRVRELFAGPRNLAPLEETQTRALEFSPYVFLRVRRTLR